MAATGTVYEVTDALGGTLIDYTNDTTSNRHIYSASVSAPAIARIEVYINDMVIPARIVYARESHTWWTGAGNPLIPDPEGLKPKDRLLVKTTLPAVLNIDWQD